MGSDLFGGLVKGLADMMPQDDPAMNAFKTQTEVSSLKKKEADIYEQIGRKAVEDGKADEYGDLTASLTAVQAEIAKAMNAADEAKKAADAAEAEKAACTCPQCGTENAPGTKFCQECGAALGASGPVVCPGCGKENPVGTKFCGGCGTKL